MRSVILYIAMSLDGYIADKSGKVDWLCGQGGSNENMDTYSAFIKDVDTVVMGWNTYHQVITELSPGEWVYKDLTSYVITHRTLCSTENIKFTKEAPSRLIKELKQEKGKAIWICGGGSIIQQLVQEGLIDEYRISIIPTILGSGIRLFGETPGELQLKLIHVETGDGITELRYIRR